LNQLKKKEIFPAFAKIVSLTQCKGKKNINILIFISYNSIGKEHLKQYFDTIIAEGGEGVMLREPHSLYTGGRSPSLRKYKPFFDTEVKVLENAYPHGFNCQQ
jgi:ATP-dependent DNA ligase